MLQLFLIFIVLFVLIFLPFLICRIFKRHEIPLLFLLMFIFLHLFDLIIIGILLSNYFYKAIIFWKDSDYQFIHSLPIKPIKNIYMHYDTEIEIETFNNLSYTTAKTILYTNECLKNFYIKDNDTCPITDIIKQNFPGDFGSNYIEIIINNNLNVSYLYYTNNNINGTLYFNNDSNTNTNTNTNIIININDSFNNIFNFSEYNEQEKLKEYDIKKVIKDFKNYTNYSDIICLSFLFVSLFLTFINIVFTYTIYIINIMIQIILFIFYLIRYIKFLELKNVFIKYKDFILNQYEYNSTNEYFPNKYFNIESFSLALQINILLIIIIYSPLFEKCLFGKKFVLEKDKNKYDFFPIVLVMIYICIFLFTTIIYLIKLMNNYHKINYRLNYLNNIWKLNPIYNITFDSNIEEDNENNENKINWKERKIIFKRLNGYDYKSIFYESKNKNNKICGKDTFGNDLYFDKYAECPINDIVITSDINFDKKGIYEQLRLSYELFLYYTNKKIDGKIINNLIASYLNDSELDFKKSEKKNRYTIILNHFL